MMATRKLYYVVVVDDEEVEKVRVGATSYHPQSNSSFWYTRSVLQSVLQLVGCKVHHAFKVLLSYSIILVLFDVGEHSHECILHKSSLLMHGYVIGNALKLLNKRKTKFYFFVLALLICLSCVDMVLEIAKF